MPAMGREVCVRGSKKELPECRRWTISSNGQFAREREGRPSAGERARTVDQYARHGARDW